LRGIAFILLIVFPDIKCKDTKKKAGMQTFYHKKLKNRLAVWKKYVIL
jgi:hypothetical protein